MSGFQVAKLGSQGDGVDVQGAGGNFCNFPKITNLIPLHSPATPCDGLRYHVDGRTGRLQAPEFGPTAD